MLHWPMVDEESADPHGQISAADTDVPRLLFVCTANRIRSPLAAALLRRLADERNAPVAVFSAGFMSSGLPAVDRAERAAREIGLDLAGHLSRTVDAEMLRTTDIVVCMETDHHLRLVELSPDCATRVFRLKELARLAVRMNPPGRPTRSGLLDWLGHVPDRDVASLFDRSLDTVDPAGRAQRAFRRCAHDLTADLTVIADAWFGPATAGSNSR